MSDLISRQSVLKLLSTIPPEEAITKAMLIQSVKQMDSETVTECNNLISRQAAIDVLDKIFPVDPMRNEYTQGITCGAALAKEYIKQLPSAQPKRGRWEVVDYEEPRRYGCSECKRLVWHTENYCPNCGARMEASDD